MTLTPSPITLEILRQESARTGRTVEQLALEAVEEMARRVNLDRPKDRRVK